MVALGLEEKGVSTVSNKQEPLRTLDYVLIACVAVFLIFALALPETLAS